MQVYVNNGHDADTPEKLADAICSKDGVPNLVLMVGGIRGKTKEPSFKMKNIKKIHDFFFENQGILAKRVAGIGDGSFTKLDESILSDFKIQSVFDYKIWNPHQLENFKPKRFTKLPVKTPGEVETNESYNYEDEDEEDYEVINNGALFSCPRANCTATYLRYGRLQKHLLSGQCKIKRQIETTEEKVRTAYISAFGIGHPERVGKNEEIKSMVSHLVGYPKAKPITGIVPLDTPLAPVSVPKEDLFKMGFALPMKKEKSRFSEEVLNYVWKIFESGKFQGKAKPEEVVQRMRKEKVKGKLCFKRKDWLTEGQVRSLFGRFAAKQKKGEVIEKINPNSLDTVTDAEEEEEVNYSSAVAIAEMAENLAEKVDQDEIPDINDHPVKVGEINLCDLAKAINLAGSTPQKALKKVKIDEKLEIVDFLQNEELLDLDFTGRGKITSEKILSEFIYDFIKEGCGCIF